MLVGELIRRETAMLFIRQAKLLQLYGSYQSIMKYYVYRGCTPEFKFKVGEQTALGHSQLPQLRAVEDCGGVQPLPSVLLNILGCIAD